MKFNKYWLFNIILSVLAICLICFWFSEQIFAMNVSSDFRDLGGGKKVVKLKVEKHDFSEVEVKETAMPRIGEVADPQTKNFEATSKQLRTYSESFSCSQEDDNNDLWYESEEPEGEGDEIPYEEGIEYPDDINDEDYDIVDEWVEVVDNPLDEESLLVDSLDDVVDEDAEVTDYPICEEDE